MTESEFEKLKSDFDAAQFPLLCWVRNRIAQARAEALQEAARVFTREADWRGVKDEDVAEIAAAIRSLPGAQP